MANNIFSQLYVCCLPFGGEVRWKSVENGAFLKTIQVNLSAVPPATGIFLMAKVAMSESAI